MDVTSQPQPQVDSELNSNGTLATADRQQRSQLSRSWRRFRRYRPGVVALVFIAALGIVALVPGLFEPHSYTAIAPGERGGSPSWEHPLGQDDIGRDILSRLIRGTRVAFIVAFAATAIALTIGVGVGAVAGYFGGWVDSVLSRLVDAVLAFPLLILLITLAAVFGPSLWTVVIVIGTTTWASYARVVRADVLSVREREFVVAARAAGAASPRIIMRHVLPTVMGPVIVLASLSVGGIILLEASLSFLGFGIQRPTPAWGSMLSDGREYIRRFPHIIIFPGIMIFLTVLAFNLIGDGLRDALDPRQRE